MTDSGPRKTPEEVFDKLLRDETPPERNRALAKRWFREVWDERLTATVDELFHPEGLGHMEGEDHQGPAAFKAARAGLLDAFPDIRIDVEDTVADGAHVVVRWRARGTHRGAGLGIVATRIVP